MEYINIGIDLGTTNSGICEFKNGKVQIIKDPIGLKDTMPSVVAFLNNRIIVGDKAREVLRHNTKHVFSSFKRNMGTDKSWSIQTEEEQEITPVFLSSLVLKELLGYQNKNINAAVITIPASFNTVQSNATKNAGLKSGLKEVTLLQEPIAACLAYANENNLVINEQKNWIVYDFGGGTFDAAIISINDREVKVKDHLGNNFLGGVDIDNKIVSDILIPAIEKKCNMLNLHEKINSPESSYQVLGKYLLYLAEEAKKELSVKEQTYIDVHFPEIGIDCTIDIDKADLNKIIAPLFNESFQIIEDLLAENNNAFTEFEKIILVGGTTYIPYIREQLAIKTGIPVDSSIDPTTAVMVGAAYYASGKITTQKSSKEDGVENHDTKEKNESLSINLSYETTTKDTEELIAFKCKTPFKGFYSIKRLDGGYDSGLVSFENKASEFIDLLPKSINSFSLTIYNENQELKYQNSSIKISHGFYAVDGQPLPNDICIELDSEDDTYLEKIFSKNQLLPLKKTLYKTFSKSILKGSDDKIIINIVEGKVGTSPGANLNIGYIEISGKNITDDLIKGTDIELNFSISESRDLKVSIYIPSIEQEIQQTFKPDYEGGLDYTKILNEVHHGLNQIEEYAHEIQLDDENYELMGKYKSIKDDLLDLKMTIMIAENNVLTSDIHQLADKKRKLLVAIDKLILLDSVAHEIEDYKFTREYLEKKESDFTPAIKRDFDKIIKEEKSFLQSGDKYLIRRKRKALDKLIDLIYFSKEDSYYNVFLYLKSLDEKDFTNYRKTKKLFKEAEKAFENENSKKLKGYCDLIYHYVKDKKNYDSFSGTGLK